MMNDMMPTIEETITPDIEAQLEHEEWERGEREREQREHWDALEAQYGPLHRHPYASYEGMVWKD
tara:strand:+ start:1164 stop:1358 length:195 start_codon:yes stop_codon:yes gene_type:complete